MAWMLAALAVLSQEASGFQFMSKWKLPARIDFEQEAAIKDKFGDKSKYSVSSVKMTSFLHLTTTRHSSHHLSL